jgi:DNA (cytosine-5)-methyltransferase 1
VPRSISLFSGVGGLESPEGPEVLCELDPDCRIVLADRFPHASLHDDVMTLDVPSDVDVVFGGWPCQDISVAGLRRGLAGNRSGLFFRMVDIAVEAQAHTIVAENVPNLLRLEGGENFHLVLESLRKSGFRYVSWRVLNARHFGLPHQRRRVFIAASLESAGPLSLLASMPDARAEEVSTPSVSSFYWTAGLQGINFSQGFSPTLKVGSSLSIPSPPALIYGDVVRQVTAVEALRLQGFDPDDFSRVAPKVVYRAMGNAVARPVGRFVAEAALSQRPLNEGGLYPIGAQRSLFDNDRMPVRWPEAGIDLDGELLGYRDPLSEWAMSNDLEELIDADSAERLSARAAAGLLSRLARSGKSCPPALRSALESLSRGRSN